MKNTLPTFKQNDPLIIYGFGATGHQVVDALIAENIAIDYIVDQQQFGHAYRDIPIISLSEISNLKANYYYCLIALNNHYIDLREIYRSLLTYDLKHIWTLQQIHKIASDVQITNGYWLDLAFNYADYSQEIDAFKALLADEKSLALANQIINYRTLGYMDDYPAPSLLDEYTPTDIPKYKGKLTVIDCGAFNGIAIEKLMHAGYEVDAFVAFEPDLKNFAQLTSKRFNVTQSICLPLGVWSSNTQLRFNSGANMGSSVDSAGDTIIQCVRVDDVLNNFAPNLIKFDVEGAEIEVINGLEKTIREHQPNLAISVYHKPAHLFEIALLINAFGLGYQFYLRVHEQNTFGTVLYCLQDRLIVSD